MYRGARAFFSLKLLLCRGIENILNIFEENDLEFRLELFFFRHPRRSKHTTVLVTIKGKNCNYQRENAIAILNVGQNFFPVRKGLLAFIGPSLCFGPSSLCACLDSDIRWA